MAVITISRQTGSLGDEIAAGLAAGLGLPLITRETVISRWLPEIADSYELRMLSESPRFYLKPSKKTGVVFKEYLEQRLREEIRTASGVIVGIGAQMIFSGRRDALNVRIIAPDEIRMKRIRRQYGLAGDEVRELLEKSDRRHKRYISTLYEKDWSDPLLYDLTLNTGLLDREECIQTLCALYGKKVEAGDALERQGLEEDSLPSDRKPPVFKHPAEEEFAGILDMYSIEWEYEPKTFPLEWDAEGNVTMAFSPDFYLVKFDTYIELTTMEQKYVTTKNKKVRRLRERYPGINIKVVYKKDFHSLIRRFGTAREGDR